MSDLFYQIVRAVGRPIIFAASHCVVLHEERAHLSGGFLLAANHQSYFESMVLVGTTTRRVDWLSIVELFQTPWQRCFMRGLNCLPLARQRRDVPTLREMIRRLRSGRVVGLFPEAGLRKFEDSIFRGGKTTPGIARLAEMGRVPVIPVVVVGAGQFVQPRAWLPGAKTFWRSLMASRSISKMLPRRPRIVSEWKWN